ncbi:MAG: hypothetical protein ABIP50_03110 [Candidatus Saccharimonadales bacterium]
MNTAKSLRDAATKEQQKALAERKNADLHRDKANSFHMNDDPKLPMNENMMAQKASETASQHDLAANDMIRQAAELEAKALVKERQKQEKIATMQNEIDKLDAEAKALRG